MGDGRGQITDERRWSTIPAHPSRVPSGYGCAWIDLQRNDGVMSAACRTGYDLYRGGVMIDRCSDNWRHGRMTRFHQFGSNAYHHLPTICNSIVAAPQSGQAPEFLAWLTAVSTAVLAVFGLFAFWQIRQSRKSREMEIMMELGRRWDAEEMIKSRSTVDEFCNHEQLSTKVVSLSRNDPRQYYELMREPGYLDDLGVIFYRGGIRGKTLFASMGVLIQERWAVWGEALDALDLQRGAPTFSYFREMAMELSPGGGSHRSHRKKADSSKRSLRAMQSKQPGPQ